MQNEKATAQKQENSINEKDIVAVATEILEKYREAFEDLISLHELHAFKIGFIRGAELRQAISKTNEPSV